MEFLIVIEVGRPLKQKQKLLFMKLKLFMKPFRKHLLHRRLLKQQQQQLKITMTSLVVVVRMMCGLDRFGHPTLRQQLKHLITGEMIY